MHLTDNGLSPRENYFRENSTQRRPRRAPFVFRSAGRRPATMLFPNAEGVRWPDDSITRWPDLSHPAPSSDRAARSQLAAIRLPFSNPRKGGPAHSRPASNARHRIVPTPFVSNICLHPSEYKGFAIGFSLIRMKTKYQGEGGGVRSYHFLTKPRQRREHGEQGSST